MTSLLQFREKLISFYRQYENLVSIALKFLVVLTAILYINGRIGYQKTLAGVLPTLIITLLCTLLPAGAVAGILAVMIVVHLYSLALEAALVGGILLLLLLLLYVRFTPGDTLLLLLYPLCSIAGTPNVLPVAGGLLYSPASALTVSTGVIINSFITFVKANETAIAAKAGDEDLIARFRFLLDGLLQNKAMLVTIIAFSASCVCVYVIRRLKVRYAWYVASAAGCVLQLIIITAGELIYDAGISVGASFLGVVLAALISAAITFFAFNLDYSAIENTQFEDDDYYYYVRAVPKVLYTEPSRSVKTISTSRNAYGMQDENFYADQDAPEDDYGQDEENDAGF